MVSPSKKKADRRIKTGPSPSNSSTTSGTRRERSCNKPLVSKPLANRRIYLDIKNQASVKRLSEKLIALGGKLELFLVREVDYVVTDRESFPTKRRPPLNQAPTPSPLPSFCSVSPATTDSPTDGLGNRKTRSRAEAMLERVKQQPQKNTTGDILDNALSWKIPIYPLNKFLVWIDKVSHQTEKLYKDQNTSANSPSAGRSVKVLTGSYLKIETGARPEFKIFSNWPSLGLSAPVERVVTPHQIQEKAESRNVNTNKKDLNCNEPSQRMTRKVGRTAAKEASSAVGGGNGYCEICRIYYDQLDSHTVSAQHLKLVTDSTQYSQLDSIIQQNNLGSNSLRKSLRIAKSPPPFLPLEMGGKQSSGSNTVTPGALETPPKDLTRGLRIKECSVSLGPPSPLLNGFSSFKSSRSVTKHSSDVSPVAPLHNVMNGCGRRSQRTHQPLNDMLPDKDVNDALPATPVKDRNLRSRKANSAQTPISPPLPERLPSPPPEKLSPPHLRSGSEKAMARSDRSLRGSEDRALPVRFSVEKSQSGKSSYTPVEVTGRTTRSLRERSVDVDGPIKNSPSKCLERSERHLRHLERARRGKDERDERSEDDESTGMTTRNFRERSMEVDVPAKTSSSKSLEKPERHQRHHERTRKAREDRDEKSDDDESTGMTTRSLRERSVDVDGPARTSPSKTLEKPERHLRHHERTRRGRDDRDERSEDDESHKRKKKEPTPEEDFREDRRRRREERMSCALEEDDKEKTRSLSTSRDKLCTTLDRVAKSDRSLRVKERPYYEEFESEESSPVYPSRPGRLPKATHKKKRVSSKSRLTKKRLSVEEKLIEDNKSYYKVEVLNSKLRSTEYFVNQKQAEERVNGDVAIDEVKPVVVRFMKIRSTELALLSDEAENFMFGDTKKDDSDEEEEDEDEDAQEGSESDRRIKEERSEGSSDRLKTETDSSSHSDLIAVKPLSSDDLARQVKEEDGEGEDEEVIEEEVAKLTYSFERPPIREPWVDAVTRQREGREFYIPMSHDYPKVILPYEVKKQRKRGRKSESGAAPTPNPPTPATAVCPSSPFHRKDRVSRLIQASIIDDKPRKSPRCHASTLAIMSTLMRRRPTRECAEKLVSYEEESSLPETVESSGSNSNSMDAKVLPPVAEISRVLPIGDFELPPGGDKIAEALLMGFTHLDNYEPASCLHVDPACVNDDLPSFSRPGLDMPVEEILRTYSSCASMNLEENLAPVRTFPSFYRSQADSCASSDCSDFLGFMEDGQAATKKRKKRRNLTGWPVEKPRRKLKDKEIGNTCLLLNNRAMTPEPARLTSAAVTPLSASSPVRRRCGRPSKIRPCLSATLPIPSPLASDHPPSPASDYNSSLPIKKKISRFGTRRSILK